MPRQARIVLSGYLHHVTQRGNYRQNIFFEDQDRVVYLKYLNENAQKYGVQIYAFCLMDNHVHFIVKPLAKDSLAKSFRVTHQRYSLYLNNRLKQFGHRWQSRFYSCVLLGEHIAKAIRYVERNPVRAGMVQVPWQYAWSSARARLGKEYKIITLSDIDDECHVSSWKNYIAEEDRQEDMLDIRQSTQQGKAAGTLSIIQNTELIVHRNLLVSTRGRPLKS
jgi:putative transposase